MHKIKIAAIGESKSNADLSYDELLASKFTLIVMTRNRSKELLECIESTEGKLGKIIVSDNSTIDYSYEFPEYVKYIKRSGLFSGIEHINNCIAEVNTDFFCIFHDDDLFLADEFSEFLRFALNNSEYAAFATNSIQLIDGKLVDKPTCALGKSEISTSDIVHFYLSPFSKGIPPLPGYIYNTEKVRSLFFDKSKGGKFCDAAFIADVSRLGKIYFWTKPTMITRLHNGNDQNSYGVSDYKRLYSYLDPKFCRNLKSLFWLYRISRFYRLGKLGNLSKILHAKVIIGYLFYLFCRAFSKVME